MRIVALDAYPITLRLRSPFVIANVNLRSLHYVVVRLRTDTGVVGYGEAIPAWEVTGETQLSVLGAIACFCDATRSGLSLLGQDVSSLEQVKLLLELMDPVQGPQRVWGAPGAKAALEGAVLDAYGKHVGKPVYSLFGGTNHSVPVACVIGVHPLDDTLEQVALALESGAHTIKLKVGIRGAGNLRNYQRDIEVIRCARGLIASARSSARLVADANQGYVTPEQAIEVAREVEGCLDWLEQPILSGDKEGFCKIRNACDVKLMADESLHHWHDAQDLLRLGAVDYLNVKLMKSGGMLAALRIADLASEYGVPCQMGSMLENQIGCALSAHAYLCHGNIVTSELCSLGMLEQWVGSGVEAGQNALTLSDSPGVGVAVDDGDLLRHATSGEAPRTHEWDGRAPDGVEK